MKRNRWVENHLRDDPAAQVEAALLTGDTDWFDLPAHVANRVLPKTGQYKFRFQHVSDSGKFYTIAHHAEHHWWGCSCPSWAARRKCKHLAVYGLPAFTVPYCNVRLGGCPVCSGNHA